MIIFLFGHDDCLVIENITCGYEKNCIVIYFAKIKSIRNPHNGEKSIFQKNESNINIVSKVSQLIA